MLIRYMAEVKFNAFNCECLTQSRWLHQTHRRRENEQKASTATPSLHRMCVGKSRFDINPFRRIVRHQRKFMIRNRAAKRQTVVHREPAVRNYQVTDDTGGVDHQCGIETCNASKRKKIPNGRLEAQPGRNFQAYKPSPFWIGQYHTAWLNP